MKETIKSEDIMRILNKISQKINKEGDKCWSEVLTLFIEVYVKIIDSKNSIQYYGIIKNFENIVKKYQENKNELYESYQLFEEFKEKISETRKSLGEIMSKEL